MKPSKVQSRLAYCLGMIVDEAHLDSAQLSTVRASQLALYYLLCEEMNTCMSALGSCAEKFFKFLLALNLQEKVHGLSQNTASSAIYRASQKPDIETRL